MCQIEKIISGGQTGVDRAAFDFALENGIAVGGFVPKGRRAEDGPIPAVYTGLVETKTRNYIERTELNVRFSDATLIVSRGALSGGTRMTRQFAEHLGKAFLHIDLAKYSAREAAGTALKWLAENNCKVSNIAGPRASSDPEIYDRTKEFLKELFRAPTGNPDRFDNNSRA